MSNKKEYVPAFAPLPLSKVNKRSNGKEGKEARYHATSKTRVFDAIPGDIFRCVPCGKNGYYNPYQHHGSCDHARWYNHLRCKIREAYNFCLYRHKKQRNRYASPGSMVMMNAKMVRAMMQKVPLSMFEMQDPKWNILMPMKTYSGVVAGAPVVGRYFADHFHDLCNEMQAYHEGGTVPKLHMFEQTPDGDLEDAWDTNYEVNKIEEAYTNEEKQLMEQGRVAIWDRYNESNIYCLFFTSNPVYIPPPAIAPAIIPEAAPAAQADQGLPNDE